MDLEKLKNYMVLPLNEDDIQIILNNIYQNQDIYLKQEFSDSYVEKLQCWLTYLGILKSLLGFLSSLRVEESSLLDLIDKGYIK